MGAGDEELEAIFPVWSVREWGSRNAGKNNFQPSFLLELEERRGLVRVLFSQADVHFYKTCSKIGAGDEKTHREPKRQWCVLTSNLFSDMLFVSLVFLFSI